MVSSGSLSSSLLWGECSLAGAIASQEWIASLRCIFTSLSVLMRDKKQWVLQRHKEANKGILMCQMKKKKLPWFNCSGCSYGMAKLYIFSRWSKALGHIEYSCCCAFMPHTHHWAMVQFRCWFAMAAAKWQKKPSVFFNWSLRQQALDPDLEL